MMEPRTPPDVVTADLRARVAEFDDSVALPPGLVDRVTAPEAPRRRLSVTARPRRWSTLVLAAAAVVCLLVGILLGIGWQRRQQPAQPAGHSGVPMTVYNAESACQPLRTIECGLSVQRDPYHKAAGEMPVARVWHGDTVVAECVVLDGRQLTDEQGVSSTRWYKIHTEQGAVGFLPGARTRNTVEIRVCAAGEVPR